MPHDGPSRQCGIRQGGERGDPDARGVVRQRSHRLQSNGEGPVRNQPGRLVDRAGGHQRAQRLLSRGYREAEARHESALVGETPSARPFGSRFDRGQQRLVCRHVVLVHRDTHPVHRAGGETLPVGSSTERDPCSAWVASSQQVGGVPPGLKRCVRRAHVQSCIDEVVRQLVVAHRLEHVERDREWNDLALDVGGHFRHEGRRVAVIAQTRPDGVRQRRISRDVLHRRQQRERRGIPRKKSERTACRRAGLVVATAVQQAARRPLQGCARKARGRIAARFAARRGGPPGPRRWRRRARTAWR